jgi:SAM-dependent methyltransferase
MKKSPVKTWSTPRIEEERCFIPCAVCGAFHFCPALECDGFSYVRCTRCGLVQMNPQPVKSQVLRRYGAADTRGGSGDDYLSYELANEGAFLRLQLLSLSDAGFWEFEATVKARLGGNEGGPKILDIGCAAGALLEELRSRGWDGTGLEISEAQAAYARGKRGLCVYGSALEESGLPSGRFDAVLASHLIEHVNDPALLAREVSRVLVPGGLFFVTTPNVAGFQARLFGGKWRSAIFDHLYLFSRKTLSVLLEQSGFEIEKVITWGGLAAGIAPPPLKRLADKAAKRLGCGDVMMIRARKNQ